VQLRGADGTWRWSLGGITLEVRHGDLLAAPERAWVNSEQTDFVLAIGGPSVSAQLAALWPGCQAELDIQTRGAECAPGTVLETSGPEERRIFHAGFHAPRVWAPKGAGEQAGHLEAIRACIDEILDRAVATELDSVAFPLIGTGVFGIAVESFSHVFFEAVALAARRSSVPLQVALVVGPAQEVDTVVRSGTQALAAMVAGGAPLLRPAGGHPLVRVLRGGVRAQRLPELQERALLHFAEVAMMTDLAAVAEAGDLGLELLTKSAGERRIVRVTFGLVLDRLHYLGKNLPTGLADRYQQRLEWLVRPLSVAAARRLVDDRNRYAHNASSRAADALVEDVEALFGPEALPDPWPDTPGRLWHRMQDGEHALLDALDRHTHRGTWLAPMRRRRFTEDVQALSPSK
jgi:O-acetyl-ADP-ribose deacetylase (regulator of RNase III)